MTGTIVQYAGIVGFSVLAALGQPCGSRTLLNEQRSQALIDNFASEICGAMSGLASSRAAHLDGEAEARLSDVLGAVFETREAPLPRPQDLLAQMETDLAPLSQSPDACHVAAVEQLGARLPMRR